MKVNPKSHAFLSPLAAELSQFLQLKRVSGCRYLDEERLLHDLDAFLVRFLPASNPIITLDTVRAFVAQRGSESECTREHRLSLIRQVCRFLAIEEPRTTIPGPRFLGIRRRPFVARVLTAEEAQQFLQASVLLPADSRSPLRRVVLGTALALLLLTGLRAGEVIRLTEADVDLINGVLRIRDTKFGKSRFVPIAEDVSRRLQQCRAEVRVRLGSRAPDCVFFPNRNGHRYSKTALRDAFHRALKIAGIPRKSGGKPLRLHDLRHSFAVLRLLIWYRQDADLGAKLPLLATYLGHVGLSSSQRYLQLTQDMTGEITRRFEARFGYLVRDGRRS